jgi:hypothetical protein
MKRMDFALLPDMARLRGNDTQVHPRLFAGGSGKVFFENAESRAFEGNQRNTV